MCIRDRSLDLILGYAGILSLGQAAFFGFAGYFTGLVATVLLGLFSLDLGWTAASVAPAANPLTIGAYFASRYSIHIVLDLAGLAIAGGLFIVPVFTAVQVLSLIHI